MINIAAAQEGQPVKPPSDEGVREQTEKPGSELDASLKAQFESNVSEKRRLEQEAMESGKTSGKRYQLLISRFESFAGEVEGQIEESEVRNEITEATEAEIKSGLTEMESLLNLIEIELATAEPEKPPNNGKKTKRNK